jgi:hypothetical protein
MRSVSAHAKPAIVVVEGNNLSPIDQSSDQPSVPSSHKRRLDEDAPSQTWNSIKLLKKKRKTDSHFLEFCNTPEFEYDSANVSSVSSGFDNVSSPINTFCLFKSSCLS